MADVAPGAEKAAVQIKDVAVALMPDRGRAPVLSEKYMAMSELLKKGKGESIFKAAVAEKDDDIYVNFTEMRKMVEGDKDPKKSDDDQSDRWKRLNLRLNIYDKWLNNGMKDLSKDEGTDVRQVLVEIPGFCDAIAVAAGGRLSFDQVRNYLTGKSTAAVTPDEKKVIGEILGQFLGDDQLRIRLEKSLSTLSSIIPPEDQTTAHEISELKDKVKGKEALLLRRKALEDSQEKFKNLNPDERQAAEDLSIRVNDFKKNIKQEYQPALLSEPAIESVLSQVTAQLDTVKTDITSLESSRFHKEQIELLDRNGQPFSPARFREHQVKDDEVSKMYIEKMKEQSELSKTQTQLESLKSIFADKTQKDLLESYTAFEHAKVKLTEVNTDLTKISDSERQLVEKEATRNKYTDKYKRKLERTLSEEIKKYWNDVKLADAAAAADAEANQKVKDKAEAKTLDELRGKKAKELLTKYLHMSFLRYKGDKCVGYEDKDLKQFVHKDMLSMSPTEIARYMLERVHDRTGMMPSRYEEEMMETLKEMGVGKSKVEGGPPLTFDQMLKEISDGTYYDLAKDFVPDVLGYAKEKGYYFDRMKLKKHEAEFLQMNYTPEFWVKMKQSREDQVKFAEKMLEDHILSEGFTEENLKKVFGNDWTQGLKRAAKVLAVGAGAYTLAGGLAGSAVGGLTPFLQEGAGIATETVKNVGTAGAALARAASRVSAAGINAIAGSYTAASVDAITGAITPAQASGLQWANKILP